MFNEKKPYGMCGANSYGWKYYQEGKHYSVRFEEMDEEGNVVETKQEDNLEKPSKALRTPLKRKPVVRVGAANKKPVSNR